MLTAKDYKINISTILNITLFLAVIHMLPAKLAAKSLEASPQTPVITCSSNDTACLLAELEVTASKVVDTKWRDKIYRELAKLLTMKQNHRQAILILDKIENHDTKALTIRGIGFAAADSQYKQETLEDVFKALHSKASQIEHKASHAIALTYISMAQSRAALDQEAILTANMIEQPALRNKAHAENAEIQAERGALSAAAKSIDEIDDAAFRDRAYRLISKIFTLAENYEDAQKAAYQITSDFERANALLEILARQIKPQEVSIIK